MENKPKPSGTPTSPESTPPEVPISRQQAALATHRPVSELVQADRAAEISANSLPGRQFRFTETETETRTRVVELVLLPDPLSSSPEEGLSDLAQQALPELVEAGIIRLPEDQPPPKIVSRATGLLAGLTRFSTAMLELFKAIKLWLGL